jgi:hypothetical protein
MLLILLMERAMHIFWIGLHEQLNKEMVFTYTVAQYRMFCFTHPCLEL